MKKINEEILPLNRTGSIFTFYVHEYGAIYLGVKGGNQILRLNFNKEKKTIQIIQKFDYENEIFSICAAPVRILNHLYNEIIR